MKIRQIQVIDYRDIPENFEDGAALRLMPKDPDPAYYAERTDRNIGWITREEQEIIRRSAIGVAGCGGMGGRLAEIFLRLGVGHIRIADSEVFDASNINRQFAALRSTVGALKAIETAKLLRAITDDSTLVVYPQGIREDTAVDFVRGCDVVCDEIEFWCVGSRILLHRAAQKLNVPVFVCNTVGFGSHIFLFTRESTTMEECLGIEYQEAVELERKIIERSATEGEVIRVMEAVMRGLFFELPEYSASGAAIQNRVFTRSRLLSEGRGAIIATNPPLACGFLADRVLLHLLRNIGIPRDIVELPPMPGYLYLDAAMMKANVVRGPWW